MMMMVFVVSGPFVPDHPVAKITFHDQAFFDKFLEASVDGRDIAGSSKLLMDIPGAERSMILIQKAQNPEAQFCRFQP